MATVTTSGLNANKGSVNITKADSSGKSAAVGTAQAMTKIKNAPGPRDKTGTAA